MPEAKKEFSKRLVWFLIIVIGVIVLARAVVLMTGAPDLP